MGIVAREYSWSDWRTYTQKKFNKCNLDARNLGGRFFHIKRIIDFIITFEVWEERQLDDGNWQWRKARHNFITERAAVNCINLESDTDSEWF